MDETISDSNLNNAPSSCMRSLYIRALTKSDRHLCMSFRRMVADMMMSFFSIVKNQKGYDSQIRTSLRTFP